MPMQRRLPKRGFVSLTKAPRGGDRHDRNAKSALQRLHVDIQSLCPRRIHHVQRQDHRPSQFGDLQRQVQVSLQVGGIHHEDDQVRRWGVRLQTQEDVPHDSFIR